MIKDLYKHTKDGAIMGYGVQRYLSPSAILGWLLMIVQSKYEARAKIIAWWLIDVPVRCLFSVTGAVIGFCMGLLVCGIKIARHYSNCAIQNQLSVQVQRRSISPLGQQAFLPDMPIQLIEPLTHQSVSNDLIFSS